MITGVMGNDLSVVKAARTSRGRQSAAERPTEADLRLLRFLAHPGDGQEAHDSPFRHAVVRFGMETTFAQRWAWEYITSQHGMVFRPKLWLQQIPDSTSARHSWRWTVSLSAFLRWFQEAEGTPLYHVALPLFDEMAAWFPYSVSERADCALLPPEERRWQPAKSDERIPVLDHGSVQLADWLDGPTPEECVLSFDIEAPLMVRSQWFKYVRKGDHSPPVWWDEEAGSGQGDDDQSGDPLYARNERSRRLSDDKRPPVFYQPQAWRLANSGGNKQESGYDAPEVLSNATTITLRQFDEYALGVYGRVTEYGIVAEQARLFLLRDGQYTSWRWTASLPAVQHFLSQRLHHASQWETQQYAVAVDKLARSVFTDYFQNEEAQV